MQSMRKLNYVMMASCFMHNYRRTHRSVGMRGTEAKAGIHDASVNHTHPRLLLVAHDPLGTVMFSGKSTFV